MGHHFVLLGNRTMNNLPLIKAIDTQLLEVIGMLVIEQNAAARHQLSTMHRALNCIITACEEHPMTLDELEHEFSLRKKEITG